MTSFERILSASGLTFVTAPTPEAPRPGARPENLEDFRHEPTQRSLPPIVSSEDAFSQWLERTKYIAQSAKQLVDLGSQSPAALARLAHAYLAADDPYLAASAATEALDSVIADQSEMVGTAKNKMPDIAAAVAAAWALVLVHQGALADSKLAELPLSAPVALMRATILADAGELGTALQLLADLESPEVFTLRGYILHRLGRPQEAIHELRNAILTGSAEADASFIMAAAFWRLGSRRKAISSARRASRLAPGRKDIGLALIDYLIDSNELMAAEAEIRTVLNSGVDDEPELLVRLARIRALGGDTLRCAALLRRTEGMARVSQDSELRAFAAGQLAIVEFLGSKIDRLEALRRVRKLIRDYPNDLSVANAFSELCDRSTMLGELRKVFNAYRARFSEQQLRPMSMRIAYLEGRYEDFAHMADDWCQDEPLNAVAANVSMVWSAYTSLNWDEAAHRAVSLLQRFRYDAAIANNMAYFSVLAGKLPLAEKALSTVSATIMNSQYTFLATRGLVQIAQGQVRDGLRDYRRAAELAERGHDGQVVRAEVIVAQGLALRLIGFHSEADDALRVGTLPAVSLPDNWSDFPRLRTIQWLCDRTDCEWPPFFDN